MEVTTEIQESADVAPKEAGVTQVPEMSVATSKQPEMQASAVMGEVAPAGKNITRSSNMIWVKT